MSALRPAKWSAALLVLATAGVAAQDEPLQKVLEKGAFEAVVQRAGEGRGGSPEDTYLAAMAMMKMNNTGGAQSEYQRLAEQGDEGWKLIGQSGAASTGGNHEEAVNTARRATEVAGGNPYAQYQLGVALLGAGDQNAAAEAFARAGEMKPDFAYAHYQAGLAFQKANNLGRAETELGYFVKLAPEAPERAAVLAVLRALRQ